MHRLALAGGILCHVMFFKYFLYYTALREKRTFDLDSIHFLTVHQYFIEKVVAR
jgi:hypothetical protein